MEKIQNLRQFNIAFQEYKKYLAYPNSSIDVSFYESSNIRTLKFLFAALRFILNKERIKTIDESPHDYIPENQLIYAASYIASYKDGQLAIGDAIFPSASEILKHIRNKIAHGDYSLNEDASLIEMVYNGTSFTIDTNKFTNYILYLIDNYDFIKISDYYKREFYNTDDHFVKSPRAIFDIKGLNNLLGGIYHIEYEFVDAFKLKPSDKDKIEDIQKQLKEYAIESTKRKHEEFDKLLKAGKVRESDRLSYTLITEEEISNFFKKNGFTVKPKITTLLDSPYVCDIKSIYRKNYKQFKKFDAMSLGILFDHINYKLVRNEHPEDNIKEGLYYNSCMIEALEHTMHPTLSHAFEESNILGLKTSHAEMITTNELLGFYIHYHYPLENLCCSKDNTEEDEYFDYSKLNLGMIKPSIFVIPGTKEDELNKRMIASGTRVFEIEDELESLNNQLKNIYEKLNSPNMDQNKKEGLKKGYEVVKNKIAKLEEKLTEELVLQERISVAQSELSKDEASGYIRNRYIIEYIRNAISHGNVTYDYAESKGLTEKTKLHFQNIYEGEKVFDLTIPLTEFDKLLGYDNLIVLDRYLISLIKKGKTQ